MSLLSLLLSFILTTCHRTLIWTKFQMCLHICSPNSPQIKNECIILQHVKHLYFSLQPLSRFKRGLKIGDDRYVQIIWTMLGPNIYTKGSKGPKELLTKWWWPMMDLYWPNVKCGWIQFGWIRFCVLCRVMALDGVFWILGSSDHMPFSYTKFLNFVVAKTCVFFDFSSPF